jgi:hypothetical protein
MTGYLLKGSKEEYLMVIRSEDIEVIKTLVHRLGQMRDKEIKALVKDLEFSMSRIESE